MLSANHPEGILLLREARDSRLVTSLSGLRCGATLLPHVCLYDCIIDDGLFSLLLTMPISTLCFEKSSRIRGDFWTVKYALASNTTLKRLEVECDEVPSSFMEALSNGIANNATLEELTWEPNYGLEHVDNTRGDSTSFVEAICKLNAAVRKCMLTDPTSREKGVDVLNCVSDDLDFLYIHLHENPSLCNLNDHSNDIPASPAKSRKRRRCPHAESDHPCVGGKPL